MNTRDKCCCFTGHRYISSEDKGFIGPQLRGKIEALIANGISDFIAGGALGFDTLAANAVLTLKAEHPHIRLILALPCKNQTRGWNRSAIAEYNRILQSADEVHYVSEEYSESCMHKRNRFMVDHSKHCIFYMTSPRGGTAYTIKYALSEGIDLINVMMPLE